MKEARCGGRLARVQPHYNMAVAGCLSPGERLAHDGLVAGDLVVLDPGHRDGAGTAALGEADGRLGGEQRVRHVRRQAVREHLTAQCWGTVGKRKCCVEREKGEVSGAAEGYGAS